jgi:hypothetical protein
LVAPFEYEHEKEKDSIVESVAFLVTPIYGIGFTGTGTWPNNSK